MKKILLLFLCSPLFVVGQVNVGIDQTICSGDIAQVIATTSVQTSTDSYQVTNITFSPEAITGTPITLSDDDMQGPFPIGFTFQFYGNNYTDFYVGSNGWIGFSSGQPTGYSAIPIPDFGVPKDCIMLSWEDLNPSTGGQVLYQTIGTAPNRKMVLTFDNIPYFLSTTAGPVTLQVVLYEGSNVIDNHITDKPLHTNPSVQGIHNLLGTSATVVPGRNATIWSANQESVRYFPSGVSWYDLNSGQMVGVGDTLYYSPSQSTFVAGIITDSTGQIFSDTMTITVLNTTISTSGFSLCNGPLVLTAQSGFSSYNWNGPSTSQMLTVNAPGSYFVICTTTSGQTCQSSPITIYQDTIPIALSTPDSVFICQGDTVIIDGPLGYITYNWSTGDITPSITTTSTGNYSLTVTDTNGCMGVSNTTTIDISPQTIIATTTSYSLCNGSVTLNAGAGFASYQWFNNGLVYFGGTFQTLIITSAGVYHCEVVYPTGCTAISNSITIVAGTGAFNVTISAIGADSLCGPNGQVVLDAGNYASFIWNTGATTQQIMVNNLGVYTVDVLDSSGCQGTSTPGFEVFNAVNTSSISGSTTPTQFQTEIYSVVSTTGSTYNWNVGLGTILAGSGTFAIQVEYGSSSFGNYDIYVIETNSDGCVGDTIFLSVFVFISAVDELNSRPHKLKKITDVLGRNSEQKKRTPLFYIYDDGTVEKRIVIE